MPTIANTPDIMPAPAAPARAAEQVIDKTISDLSTPNQKLQLMKIRITRDQDLQGLVSIEMQSDIDWCQYFVSPEDLKRQSYYQSIGGIAVYKAKRFMMPDGRAVSVNQGADDYFPDGRFNFNMLLTPQLKAGVKYTFRHPASNEHFRQWREEARAIIKSAFYGFIKPLDMTLDMVIKTGPRETTT